MNQPSNNPNHPTQMRGTVVVSEYPNVRVHTYVSPPDGWLVNTRIVEGPEKLVIFDGQLLNAYAGEVAAYASGLGKPVERVIVSHAHPDHWAGLAVLAERFPSAPIVALPAVAEQIRASGEIVLAGLRSAFGDKVAARPTQPTGTLIPGKQTIAGVRFDFRELLEAESEAQLLALMPDQKVILAFDLVFAPRDHAFTVAPNFDHWIGLLEALNELQGYDTIFIGHDLPTDQSAIDATIDYLRAAKECYAAASDGNSYAAALKAAFPDRLQPGWVDFSGRVLFRTLRR